MKNTDAYKVFPVLKKLRLHCTRGDMSKRVTSSGEKSILKLYLSKSIVTDGITTRSKESID